MQRLLNDGSFLRSLSAIVGLGEMVVGDGRFSCGIRVLNTMAICTQLSLLSMFTITMEKISWSSSPNAKQLVSHCKSESFWKELQRCHGSKKGDKFYDHIPEINSCLHMVRRCTVHRFTDIMPKV